MIIYKKTFEDVQKANCNFPVEDQFYIGSDEIILADGITRDPIGIDDFSKVTIKEMIEKYPKPSGSEIVAKLICNTFPKTSGTLKERLLQCNEAVKMLNEENVKECDYLQNDYYSSVASCIKIIDNVLEYAYICDCGIIVYEKTGKIKFQTEDDKVIYSDPYIEKVLNGLWHLSNIRARVRKEFRNNLNNVQDGRCVSYGALTGEEAAEHFIKYGKIEIENEDIIGVYSDGFVNFLREPEFIKHVINFNKEKLEEYVHSKENENYELYGKEKTLILSSKGQ